MKRLLSALVVLAITFVVSGCSLLPWSHGCYYIEFDCAPLSHETMTQIVDALNAQDAAALKEVFTENARTEFSTEIDDGVDYMLAMFTAGDVVWLDPEVEPRRGVTSNEYGKHAVWVWSSYRVTSGGAEYELFFNGWAENDIDLNDAGVTGMGAIPWNDSSDLADSNVNAAHRSWFRSLSANERPTVFRLDDGPSAPDRLVQIVNALNAQDAAALRDMFTDDVLAEFSAEIDEGLDYLLSQFPDGDLLVVPDDPGQTTIRADTTNTSLSSFYRIRSGGVDYRLYFAESIQNAPDSGNVGIYAIAAATVSRFVNEGDEAYIYDWIAFDVDRGVAPGIYIPEDDNG